MEGARNLDNKEETEREVHFKEVKLNWGRKKSHTYQNLKKTKAVPCKETLQILISLQSKCEWISSCWSNKMPGTHQTVRGLLPSLWLPLSCALLEFKAGCRWDSWVKSKGFSTPWFLKILCQRGRKLHSQGRTGVSETEEQGQLLQGQSWMAVCHRQVLKRHSKTRFSAGERKVQLP